MSNSVEMLLLTDLIPCFLNLNLEDQPQVIFLCASLVRHSLRWS